MLMSFIVRFYFLGTNGVHSSQFHGENYILTGTGLSDLWHKNPEENVAAEYEDQADCFGNSDSVDPHHSPLYLPRVQLCKKISCFLPEAFVLFIKLCNYISREILYMYMS